MKYFITTLVIAMSFVSCGDKPLSDDQKAERAVKANGSCTDELIDDAKHNQDQLIKYNGTQCELLEYTVELEKTMLDKYGTTFSCSMNFLGTEVEISGATLQGSIQKHEDELRTSCQNSEALRSLPPQ